MIITIGNFVLVAVAPILTRISKRSQLVFNVMSQVVHGWLASTGVGESGLNRKRFFWYLRTMKPFKKASSMRRAKTQPTWEF